MRVFRIMYSMKMLERMKFKPKGQDIHDFAIELARQTSDKKKPYVYLPEAHAVLQKDGDTILVTLQ